MTAEPAYFALQQAGMLEERTRRAVASLASCRLCPRGCGASRLAGKTGACRIGRRARVASAHAHFGEERPLVGRCGSGTIFFSFCNLLCSFCQNVEISHGGEGDEVDPPVLAALMLRLQAGGCHNINLVTPTAVTPQILEALPLAVGGGLKIPLVYNCGGYESVETLRLLDGVVDIYMPDFKFWDNRWAERCCGVTDYRERAVEALQEMHRQVGDLDIGPEGVARRGLLVRHLVLPHGMAGTAEVMAFVARDLSRETYVNVMAQYRPCGPACRDPLLNRRITAAEFAEAVEAARQEGLHRLD